MYTSKETISRENTYKAFLLYGLVGGCCLINLINYMETIKFNKELQKQIKLCKKMIYKKKILEVET
jgi:DMSO reductase anchor subunit